MKISSSIHFNQNMMDLMQRSVYFMLNICYNGEIRVDLDNIEVSKHVKRVGFREQSFYNKRRVASLVSELRGFQVQW